MVRFNVFLNGNRSTTNDRPYVSNELANHIPQPAYRPKKVNVIFWESLRLCDNNKNIDRGTFL